MIYKQGEKDDRCSNCGRSVAGELVTSYADVRCCTDCSADISPDFPICWAILNELGGLGIEELRAQQVANIILKELEDYGMYIGKNEGICKACLGTGKKSYYGHQTPCDQCNGSGLFNCVACNNTGKNIKGIKCEICRN